MSVSNRSLLQSSFEKLDRLGQAQVLPEYLLPQGLMVMKKALMIFYSAIKNELPEVNRIFQDWHSVNMVIKYSPKRRGNKLTTLSFL